MTDECIFVPDGGDYHVPGRGRIVTGKATSGEPDVGMEVTIDGVVYVVTGVETCISLTSPPKKMGYYGLVIKKKEK